MKKTNLLFIIFLLFIPLISAKQGHLTLLAVKETPDGFEGSTADLYLELRQGTGRVFLDTYPLTKLDTQMSTRFAKEIACEYLDIDCDSYDFIYTIKAGTAIIGGPSAGAAISALTISELLDLNINEKITITGTINSGGIIGPVSGLKEKIQAAAAKNLKKVIIAKGERFVKESKKTEGIIILPLINILNETLPLNETDINLTEETIDLVEYGKEIGIEVIEASDLNEAFFILSGKTIKADTIKNLVADSSYSNTMKQLALDLCNRSEIFIKKIAELNNSKSTNNNTIAQITHDALNLSLKGKNAFDKEVFYSSASYCFGANVKYSYLLFLLRNLTRKQILEELDDLNNQISILDKRVMERKKKTITDLESFMAVKERLVEAKEYTDKINATNLSKNDFYDLAYSKERVYSAFSWYEFFDNRGKEFNINKEIVEKACKSKLAEADERLQYIKTFLPKEPEKTEKEINNAFSDANKKNFELCLFKASKSKAEVDMITSLIGVREDKLKSVVKQKLEIAKKNIIEQQQKGIFPILGYSYYEYANTLLESDDVGSSILYTEYALELSNLDMYFKEKKKIKTTTIDYKTIYSFGLGTLFGLLIGILVMIKIIKTKKSFSIKKIRKTKSKDNKNR